MYIPCYILSSSLYRNSDLFDHSAVNDIRDIELRWYKLGNPLEKCENYYPLGFRPQSTIN